MIYNIISALDQWVTVKDTLLSEKINGIVEWYKGGQALKNVYDLLKIESELYDCWKRSGFLMNQKESVKDEV